MGSRKPKSNWRGQVSRNWLRMVVAALVLTGMGAAAGHVIDAKAIGAAVRTMDWVCFGASAVLLTASFVMCAALWHRFLRDCGYVVHWRTGLASRLIPVFAKYLPGKVWSLLGTSLVVNDQQTTYRAGFALAAVYQAAIVIAGILVGMVGIAVYGARFGLLFPGLALLGGVCVGLSVYCHGSVRRWVGGITQRLLGNAVDVRPAAWVTSVGGNVSIWLLVGVAQWSMIRSMGLDAGYAPILLQPLANVAGMLFVVAPAGIGIREGVMVAYLRVGGLDLESAVLVSLVARIWSLAGESGAFFSGLIIGRGQNPGG